jgi:hypothetical protein
MRSLVLLCLVLTAVLCSSEFEELLNEIIARKLVTTNPNRVILSSEHNLFRRYNAPQNNPFRCIPYCEDEATSDRVIPYSDTEHYGWKLRPVYPKDNPYRCKKNCDMELTSDRRKVKDQPLRCALSQKCSERRNRSKKNAHLESDLPFLWMFAKLNPYRFLGDYEENEPARRTSGGYVKNNPFRKYMTASETDFKLPIFMFPKLNPFRIFRDDDDPKVKYLLRGVDEE